MSRRTLTILYPDDLLRSHQETPDRVRGPAAAGGQLLRVSTGRAAELAGLPRIEFLHSLHQFQVSPFSDDPKELDRDVANALG